MFIFLLFSNNMKFSSHSKSKKTGFTLLELMFVIVIIAILATLSLPIYQDYSSKTQIHVAYQSISTLKNPINLRLLQSHSIVDAVDLGWLSGNSSLFLNDPTITIDSDTGVVSLAVVLDGKANPVAKGVKITLLRDNHGNWRCTLKKVAGSS